MSATLTEDLKTFIDTKFKDLNDNAVKKIEALQTEVEILGKKHREFEKKIESGEIKRTGISVPGVEPKKFAFSRMLRGMVNKRAGERDPWKGSEYEKEVLDATYAKALSESVETAGGFLVPTEIMDEFIELLRVKLVLQELGVRMVPGLSGSPVELPGQSGGATAYWVNETQAVTRSQQTFKMKQMTPRKLGCLVPISNRLIRMASPAVEDIVRRDMTAVMARAWELALLFGPGGNAQPRGLINTPDILTHTIGANGGTFNYDHINEMVGTLEDADSNDLGEIKFLFHNKVKRKLKQLKVAFYSGQTEEQAYLLGRPPVSDAVLADTMGYQFKTTNAIATNLAKGTSTTLSRVIAGIWSEMLVGWWRNLEFKASDVAGDANGSAFTQDQNWIIAFVELDVMFRQEKAFCLNSDAETV